MTSLAPPTATRRWLTLAVFTLALVARLLFWQATPDRGWPHSALYKGDAVVWTDYAAALSRGGSLLPSQQRQLLMRSTRLVPVIRLLRHWLLRC